VTRDRGIGRAGGGRPRVTGAARAGGAIAVGSTVALLARFTLLALLALLVGSCGQDAPTGADNGAVGLDVRIVFPGEAGSSSGAAPSAAPDASASSGAGARNTASPGPNLLPATGGIDSISVLAFESLPNETEILRASRSISLAPSATTFEAVLEVPPADLYRVEVLAFGVRVVTGGSSERGLLFRGAGLVDSVVAGSARSIVIQLRGVVPQLFIDPREGTPDFSLRWTSVADVNQYRLREIPSGTLFTTQDTTFIPPVLVAKGAVAFRVRAELSDGRVGAFSESVSVGEAAICAVSPATVDFGSSPVGVPLDTTVTITNGGGGTVTGNVFGTCADFTPLLGAGPFSLELAEQISVRIEFLPTSVGPETCRVETGATCGPIVCTGIGLPNPICLQSLGAIDFGSVAIGASRDSSFTITNVGTGNLIGSILAKCGDYQILSPVEEFSLGPKQSQEVIVRFQPTTAGALECPISAGTECPGLLATGTGVALEPACGVSQNVLDYGAIFVGESATMSVLIENTGAGSLSGTATISGRSCDFSIVSGESYELGPGKSQEVFVRYAPMEADADTCALLIGNALCPDVSLIGSGLGTPDCEVNADSLDFGIVTIGNFADLPLTIRNIGSATLTGIVSSACSTFSIVGGGGGYSLEPDSSLAVVVRFTPAAATSDTCAISTGGLCAPVVCTGAGEAQAACLVAPESLDFGVVYVDSTRDASFTITNNGGGTLSGSAAIGTGASCGYFSIVSGGGAFALGAQQSQMVTVRYAPSKSSASGTHTCEVQLGSACAPVLLTGVAIARPVCTVSDSVLDFGDVALGQSSELNITITNDGGSLLSGNTTITPSCADFAIAANGGPFTSSPGTGVVIAVRFEPTQKGPLTCAFETGTTFCPSITLTGVGVPAPIAPACSVSVTTLNFGAVVANTTKDLTFSITNVGGDTLSGIVRRGAATSDCAAYTIVSDSVYALANGESQVFSVRFRPPVGTRSFNCALTLGTGTGCPNVQCTGSGVPPAACGLNTTLLNFDKVVVGQSRDKTLIITNTGGSTLVGAVTESCGPYSIVGSASYSLVAGQPKNFTIRFSPTTLGFAPPCTLKTGSTCNPVVCQGEGVQAGPACSVSPTTLDFDTLGCIGFVDRSFTVTNTGTSPLPGSVSLTNSYDCASDFGFFEIFGVDGSFPLSPNQSLTVTVRFTGCNGFGNYATTVDLGTVCTDVYCKAYIFCIGKSNLQPRTPEQ